VTVAHSPKSAKGRVGLVLSGGGARGAYQAGVLSGISEIIGQDYGDQPFPIITGISAGSINASYLASASVSFKQQAGRLVQMWSELASDQVIRTNPITLGRLGFGWLKDLSTGGLLGHPQSTHLLDSSPLEAFLKKRIDFNQLRRNIDSKVLDGVSVTATSYATGTSVAFFDSRDLTSWSRSARIGVKTTLALEHVLASSSIPIFFKPVRIGKSFFGDGGIRSASPLSPAIHLGAERIIAIGVRHPRDNVEAKEINQQVVMKDIAMADIAGVLLNSLFLDALEFDHERLARINETVGLLEALTPAREGYSLRKISTLLFLPTVDLGAMAANHFERFPAVLKYLLKGIGASKDNGADMLSYLAFDQAYTQSLIEVGYKDAMAKREEIVSFFDHGLCTDTRSKPIVSP
jgi:NTE family protein